MWESFRNVYRRKRCTHVTFSSLKLLISMCVTVHLPTHFDSLILIRLLFFFFFLTSTESSTSFMVMYGIKFLTSFLLYPGALVQLHYLSFFVCFFTYASTLFTLSPLSSSVCSFIRFFSILIAFHSSYIYRKSFQS